MGETEKLRKDKAIKNENYLKFGLLYLMKNGLHWVVQGQISWFR